MTETMKRKLRLGAAFSAIFLGSLAPANGAETPPAAHFAPEEDLEAIDVRAIDDLPGGGYLNAALFVLSDYRVIASFERAARRGKKVRLYLDPRELKMLRLRPDHPLCRLAATENVIVKVKTPADDLMHDKDWSADGVLWRTGSANLSLSGLHAQDNSLILISARSAIAAFDRHFEAMWSRPSNQPWSCGTGF